MEELAAGKWVPLEASELVGWPGCGVPGELRGWSRGRGRESFAAGARGRGGDWRAREPRRRRQRSGNVQCGRLAGPRQLLKGPQRVLHLLLVVAGQGLSQGLWRSLSVFPGHLPPALSSALVAGRSQRVCCAAQPQVQVLGSAPPEAPRGGCLLLKHPGFCRHGDQGGRQRPRHGQRVGL